MLRRTGRQYRWRHEMQGLHHPGPKKQNDEISKMLKDKNGSEPNNLEIAATRLSAVTYCQTAGTPDSKISEAPHG
jgi:hypothetical protein